jgi:hypothetical protein
MAFFAVTTPSFCKKFIITLVSEKNANHFAENWQKSQKIVIITSAPWFLPIEQFFLPACFSKLREETKFVRIFHKKVLLLKFEEFDKICMYVRVGPHFGRLIIRGRCYDHNFLRFLTNFGKKLAFFL